MFPFTSGIRGTNEHKEIKGCSKTVSALEVNYSFCQKAKENSFVFIHISIEQSLDDYMVRINKTATSNGSERGHAPLLSHAQFDSHGKSMFFTI